MPVTKTILIAILAVVVVIGVILAYLFISTQPQEVVFIRFAGWGAGVTEIENYKKVISEFQARHPNIRVRYEPISQMFHENVLAAFPAGAAPDVFYVDSAWAPIFISKGVLKPLNDLEPNIDQLKAQYYDFLLEPFTDQAGRLYGLPKDWSILFLAYNKQCLSQAGITTVPNTWSDFIRALETITDRTGKPALVDHYHWRTFIVIALAYGAPYPDFTSEASIRAWFANPAVRQALKDYMDLYLNGYIARRAQGKVPYVVLPRDVDSGWGGEAFGKQQACFTFEGSWMIPFIKDQFPGFKYGEHWDIAVIPTGPGGRITLAFTVILGINSKSSNPSEAYAFAKYVAGKEGQEFLVVELGHTLPSIKELANSPKLWAEHRKTLDQLSQYTRVYLFPTMKSDKAGPIISTFDSVLHSYIAKMKETGTYDFNALITDLTNAIIAQIKG